MCIAGPQLWCPSSWKLYLNDFPFLGSFQVHLDTKLQLFEVDDHGDAGNNDLSHHHLPNCGPGVDSIRNSCDFWSAISNQKISPLLIWVFIVCPCRCGTWWTRSLSCWGKSLTTCCTGSPQIGGFPSTPPSHSPGCDTISASTTGLLYSYPLSDFPE